MLRKGEPCRCLPLSQHLHVKRYGLWLHGRHRDFGPGVFFYFSRKKIKESIADIKNVCIFAVLKRYGEFRKLLKTQKDVHNYCK